MKVKFKKGIGKDEPNTWSSTNLFYITNTAGAISIATPDRKKKCKAVIKILKEHGFTAEVREFMPKHWDTRVHAVCLDLDAAQEAYFILFANGGIEI